MPRTRTSRSSLARVHDSRGLFAEQSLPAVRRAEGCKDMLKNRLAGTGSVLLKDPSLASKADALLARMSLDQKIGQMTQPERMTSTPEDVKAYHLGSVLSGGGSCPGDNRPRDWVDMNDAYWAASMEEDENHLAIPLMYGVDAVHGNSNVIGATVFPHNIGLGAANDPDLIERIARITAREILATGVDWSFAPTLAVARNEQWGRTYESYSEDPAIVTAYANRFVAGMQGDLGSDGVVACAKHWVGDGGTTHGIEAGTAKNAMAINTSSPMS